MFKKLKHIEGVCGTAMFCCWIGTLFWILFNGYIDIYTHRITSVPGIIGACIVGGMIPTICIFSIFKGLLRRWKSVHGLTEEQRRYLTLGAVLHMVNEEPLHTLRDETMTRKAARKLLHNWWGIDKREEAIETVRSLSMADVHTPDTDVMLRGYVKRKQTSDDDQITTGLSAYQRTKNDLLMVGCTEQELDQIHTTAAFDLGRTVFVASRSVEAGYLQEDEAWSYLKIAAENAARMYSGWRQYMAAYVIGRALGFRDSKDIYHVMKVLVDENNKYNPFNQVAFK